MNVRVGKGRYERAVPEQDALRRLRPVIPRPHRITVADHGDTTVLLDEVVAYGLPRVARDDRSFVNRHTPIRPLAAWLAPTGTQTLGISESRNRR